MEQLGLPASASGLSRRVFDRGQDVASVNISEDGNLVFAGGHPDVRSMLLLHMLRCSETDILSSCMSLALPCTCNLRLTLFFRP